jgi:hypothetical protein
MTYGEYYQAKNALEDLLPSKRDLARAPDVVRLKAEELRLLILGALAELNEAGWEDDD